MSIDRNLTHISMARASSFRQQRDRATDLLRELAALKRYDPNVARGATSSRQTVNVPVELLARIDDLLELPAVDVEHGIPASADAEPAPRLPKLLSIKHKPGMEPGQVLLTFEGYVDSWSLFQWVKAAQVMP